MTRLVGDPMDERGPSHSGREQTALPLFRLVVGLGDPECERLLLPALSESDDFVITERCLAADQLLAVVASGRADVVLISADLHRLTAATLVELSQTATPLVLLAPNHQAERWQTFPGHLLPPESDPECVREALLAAIRRERPQSTLALSEPERDLVHPADEAPPALDVLAITSGHGSPGRTTVAVGLAAALGAVEPTILVDADLFSPSVAARLDLDPTRNLYMLANAEPERRGDWDRSLTAETQPLGTCSPHAVVLCGVPKPELRSAISPRFFGRLLAELRQRFRYVIIDVAPELPGTGPLRHEVLHQSDHVLFVVASDLVGLWRGADALKSFATNALIGHEKLALIINCHDRRRHHSRAEIEWALGIPSAAVIPYDHRAAQQALAAQQPLVLHNRSRASRVLFELAERIYGGEVVSPRAPATKRRFRRGKRLPTSRPPRLWRGRDDGLARDYVTEQGARYGDDVAITR